MRHPMRSFTVCFQRVTGSESEQEAQLVELMHEFVLGYPSTQQPAVCRLQMDMI